ncbi:cytochrome c3 family protein [Myxococcus sp. RHSTA-1-4]|uniref:cytochrome c3 family protein n=1 Tax=Myxococcus sp. RHSTA-1-4 TaxID=2874601 RepID=UPI001CC000EC|nr:cytochrome c3 family protein [Myxococcus sp. RHSTA-1-4]MBZ4418602.1 hypothetical protein [Myxococcus sp. RHSTA-1-4]
MGVPRHFGRPPLAWALAVFLLLGASGARAGDFFSPGELARPHAALEGLSNCTKCHEAGQKLSQERCLSCHTELASGIRAGEGFHGRIPASERACESCHREHQGREHALVDWGPRKQGGFDHGSRTGFPLEGRHSQTKCEQCHQPRLIVDDTLRALLKKHPERETFLGLGTACTDCHFDEHRGQLGAKCEQCHSPKAWKPASGFDHAKTGFALEGAHRKKVTCTQCHSATQTDTPPPGTFPAPRSATFVRFEKLPHASCLDCHQDPHQSRFGERCESCHTVEDWHQIRNAQQDRAFHDKTRFPLRGLHVDVDCKSCHGPFPGRPRRFKGLAFSTCESCHVDAHLGQLAGADGRTPPCEQCHSVEGFSPARFGVEQHAKTQYPLMGSHLAVACDDCHREEPKLAHKAAAERQAPSRKGPSPRFSLMLFDFPSPGASRCESCHADPHAGQFTSKAECATCHQVDSFHALRFQHDRDSRFPLTGKHASVTCESCHRTVVEKGRELVRFRPMETACASCHEDVHAGQFAPAPGQPTDCTRCHDTASFKPAGFAHSPPFTDFVLQGKHADVPCERCHRPVQVGSGLEVRRYEGLPRDCAGCHADAHHGAFQGFQP